MPLAPGQAPPSHQSVALNNIGAKPVMPHQMAPQFGASQNKQQALPKEDPEDPFQLSW